ncbi:MAG: hypothetical protein K0U84_13540 [Actinomycetia bacterium]|nr:hypothetical protein [Actinomycetes bacterium]
MSYSDQHHDGSFVRLDEPVFTLPDPGNLKRVVNDRLPGPNGDSGTGLTFKEATTQAAGWWEKTRKKFLEVSRPQTEHGGMPSGICRALPFDQLHRAEALRVIEAWYDHVALPMLRGEVPPEQWILDDLAHMGGSTEFRGPTSEAAGIKTALEGTDGD